MTFKTNRFLLSFSLFALFGGAACAEPDPALDQDLSVASQALDNTQADPNDGKTCYVDGPISGMGKGKMDNGFCCVPSPKPEETCFFCGDEIFECQIGGGDVGVRVGGALGTIGVVGDLKGGTLSTGDTAPRGNVAPRATTLSTGR